MLITIAPPAIERIEVIRDGTAAYGVGAKGGLISVHTIGFGSRALMLEFIPGVKSEEKSCAVGTAPGK